MKITLIVSGIVALEFALGVLVGKTIRAGSTLPARIPARCHPDLESHGLHVVASRRSRAEEGVAQYR